MNEYLKKVLSKMCELVDVKFEDINFQEENWYLKHSVTEEQRDIFIKWFEDYLLHNIKARRELMSYNTRSKRRINKFVRSFWFNYGWKEIINVRSN